MNAFIRFELPNWKNCDFHSSLISSERALFRELLKKSLLVGNKVGRNLYNLLLRYVFIPFRPASLRESVNEILNIRLTRRNRDVAFG